LIPQRIGETECMQAAKRLNRNVEAMPQESQKAPQWLRH